MTEVQPGQVGHRFPQVLPGGRYFLSTSAGTPETAGVYVARLDGSDARRLVPADSAAVFASSGHLLFIKQGTLHALRFDPARLAVHGSPFSVAENVAVDSGFGRPAISAATTGLDPLSPSRRRRPAAIHLVRSPWAGTREVGRAGQPVPGSPIDVTGRPPRRDDPGRRREQ